MLYNGRQPVNVELSFLLSYSNHKLVNLLIKDNRKGSNKILKEIFLNYENLGFLKNFDQLVELINCCITTNNKNIYMVALKHIRQYKLTYLLFQKNNLELRSKILSTQVLKSKGVDYGSIFLSFYQDKNLVPTEKRIILSYLKSIHDLKKENSAKVTKIKNILKYLQLAKAIGYKNKDLASYAREVLGKISKKSLTSDDGEGVYSDFVTPRTTIRSGTTLNIAKLSPEEYWLMNNSGYLA